MLKHLPPNAVNTLLQTVNNIWFAGNFPPSWRTSTVIPLSKPAKDASDPSNYRSIAPKRCLCKVMERMVNNRLVWFLERNTLITALQCGFSQTTQHYRPRRTFRIFYSTATCRCRIFRLGKGFRLYSEVWHHKRLPRGRSAW